MSNIKALPDRTITALSQPQADHLPPASSTVSSTLAANMPSALTNSTEKTTTSAVLSFMGSGLGAVGNFARGLTHRTRTKAEESNTAKLKRPSLQSDASKTKDRLAQELKARVDKKNRTKNPKPAKTTMRAPQSLQWDIEASNIYGDYQAQLNKLCSLQRSDVVKLEVEFDIKVEAINDKMKRVAEDKASASVSFGDIASRSKSLVEMWDDALQWAIDGEADINHKFNAAGACIENDYDKAKASFLNKCAEMREMSAHSYLPNPLPIFSKLVDDQSALYTAALPGRQDFDWPSGMIGSNLILFPTTKLGPVKLSARPANNPKDSGESDDEGSESDAPSDDGSNVVSKRLQCLRGQVAGPEPASNVATIDNKSNATAILDELNL